jgi:hypothetical protein
MLTIDIGQEFFFRDKGSTYFITKPLQKYCKLDENDWAGCSGFVGYERGD